MEMYKSRWFLHSVYRVTHKSLDKSLAVSSVFCAIFYIWNYLLHGVVTSSSVKRYCSENFNKNANLNLEDNIGFRPLPKRINLRTTHRCWTDHSYGEPLGSRCLNLKNITWNRFYIVQIMHLVINLLTPANARGKFIYNVC